ncbi:Rha family transcriptional regulator [Pseudomonas weihenstephanensis]|uniref:Rha family transcriptional regulator n=1 Tax=Pseudomonas weihenstephanensis TaxID=1608994 RepID=UPI00193B191B|nr:Rha family transcriptional regulator [Pseudomonas weihenstephanensis]MBM1192687.1 transcriptional regulator [Pseudomonas weihenstephanensis]
MLNTMNEITMSTVEIAAMTGKRHDNVLRDADRAIELVTGKMASDLRASIGATEAIYQDAYKRDKRMLVLNKQMVFTVITGYDTSLRYTIIGRWIELELAANPAFGSQAITDTLIDLQSRVDMMAPAYAEHTRKGTREGYTWREACRLADVEHPDKVLAMFKAKGLVRTSEGLTEIHPKYIERGHAKAVNQRNKAVKLTGHLFRITHKGLTEWLQPKSELIAKALKDHLKVRPVLDEDGFVVAITGEGSNGQTVFDIATKL